MSDKIRMMDAQRDKSGGYEKIRIGFGPHYFLELDSRDGKVMLTLGATHHGIRADASEVNGELEQLINELRRNHPQNVVD